MYRLATVQLLWALHSKDRCVGPQIFILSCSFNMSPSAQCSSEVSEDRRAQPARCSGRLHLWGQCHALSRPPEPHPSLRSRPHTPHEDGEWVCMFTSKSNWWQRQGAKSIKVLRREGWAKIRPDICMLSQTHYLLTLTSGFIPDWQCSLSPVAVCFLSDHFFSRYKLWNET